MTENLSKKMLQEFEDKSIFEQAKKYAFAYAEHAFDRNVFPTKQALNDLTQFDETLPDHVGDPAAILQQLHQYGSPATVSQIGGRYFGFVDGGVIPTALAARWLADFWDQNSALYAMSPITAKLEQVAEDWLKQLLGLPEHVVAGFVSGSSLAIFCGLAAGRYRVLQNQNWDVNKKGLNGAPPIRVVAGKQAHATVTKAIALLGLGSDNIEWMDTDAQGRVLATAVPPLNDSTILILQAGNVNSGAYDEFDTICERARQANAWVHIDGAFGLWAAACERLSHLTNGIAKANSWSVDGHKTLNTPYDSGVVLCNDKAALINALQATGDYIVHSENRDGMMYTPEMSRRARAIELWATLKYLGKAGADELIFGLHERACQFAQELKENGFDVLNDVVFNQVVVACGSDEETQLTLKFIQESGECWVGGSIWNGRSIIRISVCSWATTKADVSRSVGAFVTAKAFETANKVQFRNTP